MPRTIGSVEVFVEADTGRLRAQMIRGGERAGKAGKEAIEQQLKRLDVKIDDRGALSEARRAGNLLEKALEAQLQGIDIGLDTVQARRDLREFDAWAEAQEVAIHGQLSQRDFAKIQANLRQWRQREEANEIEMAVDLQILASNIAHDKAVLEEMMGELDIPVDVDLADERAKLAAFRREQESDTINIPVDIDEGGRGGGPGTLSARWKAIIGSIVLLAEPAAVALEGLLAQATAVASSAFSALGGAIGTTAPFFAALGASITTLIVGFQDVGGAMGAVSEEFATAAKEGRAFNAEAVEIEEAMSGLTPAARDVVEAFADLRPELNAVRDMVQERLFADLDDELRNVANVALPAIGRGLGRTADQFNDFFAELADRAADVNFDQIFEDLLPVIEDVLDIFVSLMDALEPFLHAAAPAAQELADSFAAGAEALADMIAAGEQSGGLESFLAEGVESLKLWGGLMRELGDALFTIFQAGQATGDSFLTKLTDIVARWDDWLESVAGQEALADFFATGERLASALVPVLEGLQGFFENIITPDALDRFDSLAENVGKVLPVLGSLLELVGEMGILETMADLLGMVADAITPILPDLRDLAKVIGDGLADALDAVSPLFPKLADLIGRVADIIGPVLEPAFDLLATTIEALWPLFDVGIEVMTEWLTILEENPEILEAVTVALELLADVISALAGPIETAAGLLGGFVDVVGNIKGAILGAPFGLFGAGLEAITGGGIEGTASLTGLGHAAKDTANTMGTSAASYELTADAIANASREIEFNRIMNNEAATSYELVNNAITDAAEAHRGREEALKKEREAAYDTWQEELQLAEKTEETAIAAADAAGYTEDFASKVVDLGNAARDSAEKADALRSAIDLLIAPAADVEQSFSDLQEAIDEFDIIIQGGQKAIDLRVEGMEKMEEANRLDAEAAEAAAEAQQELREGNESGAESAADRAERGRENAAAMREEAEAALAEAEALDTAAESLDLNTEAGRANAEFLRSEAQTTLDWAAGMIQAGESADVVTAKVAMQRETLEQQAEAFGLTEEEADAYINTLLGTPEFLNTLIQTPGMFDALLNAQDLTLLYDDMGEPVITEFEALGLDPALANSQEFKDLLEELDVMVATPVVDDSKAAPTEETVTSIESALGILDETQAHPTADLDGDGQEDVDTLQDDINALDRDSATPRVSVANVDPSIAKVDRLGDEIAALHSKTVTITVNQRIVRTGAALPFGIELPGGMAGEMINGPTVRRVGERGYREAIVPLDLPLHRVNPEVRDLAALIRGEGATVKLPGGRTINNYMTITPTQADPVVVATKLMNRAAAMGAGL